MVTIRGELRLTLEFWSRPWERWRTTCWSPVASSWPCPAPPSGGPAGWGPVCRPSPAITSSHLPRLCNEELQSPVQVGVDLLDDLQELVSLVDEAWQFVERPPKGRGPPAEVARQCGRVCRVVTVGGAVRVPVCPARGGPAVVASVLPLSHHTRPHLTPAKLHCWAGLVDMSVTSLCRGRPLGFFHKSPFWFWLLLLMRRGGCWSGARSRPGALSGDWTRRRRSGSCLQTLPVFLSVPRQTAVMVSMTVTVVVSWLWRSWWYWMPAWWWIRSSYKS